MDQIWTFNTSKVKIVLFTPNSDPGHQTRQRFSNLLSLGGKKWLFELLLSLYHLLPVWPFSSDINRAFLSTHCLFVSAFIWRMVVGSQSGFGLFCSQSYLVVSLRTATKRIFPYGQCTGNWTSRGLSHPIRMQLGGYPEETR